jgi:uncharacterized protein (TIGR02391 family)
MGKRILDPKIVEKLCKATKLKPSALRVKVSQLASRKRVASEVALVLLANRHDIGTAMFQRSLDAGMQSAIRDALDGSEPTTRPIRSAKVGKVFEQRAPSRRDILKGTIDLLINDQQLRSKCGDILLARANYDRPINQATLVLEDRIRKKVKPPIPMVGETLINYAFNEKLEKTRLQVASAQAEEQRGITIILRGFVPAFRNTTHHHIVDTFTQEDAIRTCAFIDLLLRVVDSTKVVSPME